MKLLLTFLLLIHGTCLWAAEFTFSVREASFEPRDGFVEQAYKTNQKIFIGPDSGITAKHVVSLTYHEFHGEPALGITLDAAGAAINHLFTQRVVKKPIAIFINQQLIAAPVVITPSHEEFVIAGSSKDDIEKYIAAFRKR